jgi:hypothetical protein
MKTFDHNTRWQDLKKGDILHSKFNRSPLVFVRYGSCDTMCKNCPSRGVHIVSHPSTSSRLREDCIVTSAGLEIWEEFPKDDI